MSSGNNITTNNVILLVVVVLLALVIVNTFGGLIIPIIMWMLAGMIAGRLMRGRGYGPIADVGLGLVGGFVGSVLLSLAGLGFVGAIPLIGNIVVGVVGAVVFIFLARLIHDSDFAK